MFLLGVVLKGLLVYRVELGVGHSCSPLSVFYTRDRRRKKNRPVNGK